MALNPEFKKQLEAEAERLEKEIKEVRDKARSLTADRKGILRILSKDDGK